MGKLATFDFQNLNLQHDKLVFFNVFVRNNLGKYYLLNMNNTTALIFSWLKGLS